MKYKILVLFANHTNNKIKYNITLNNISFIKKYISNIIIIDSENEYYANLLKKDLESSNLVSNYFYVKNDIFYDFGKWACALEKINYTDYDYILFLNDSIILTQAIEKYFYYIDNIMSPDTNLYAYNDSTQIMYHYQSYLFLIKSSIVNNFLNFFENKKQYIHNLETLIKNVELNMCNIDKNHDVFIKIGNEYNYEKNLYWHNEDLYKYLLTKDIFAIIKLKKIFDIQKEYKITIYGNSINNFDYVFYKEHYNLQKMSDQDALKHFIIYGQYEGRNPNNNFNVMLPKYYREKLEDIGLLYLFDVPDDFDIYYYKKNNPDIENLSFIDIIYHYIHHGYFEGRIYNKSNTKDSYLNNFYLELLSKIENINNIKLPHNFSLYSAYFLNNFVDNYEYYGIIKKYNQNNNILYDKDLFKKITENFDLNTYKRTANLELNDLIHNLQHYINNNSKNSIILKLPRDFNHELYKKIYIDLSKLSNEQLEEHYVLHGIKENRIYKLPEDFIPSKYKEMYSDLKTLNDDQLKEHYLFKGIIEKRVYKLIHNSDLKINEKNKNSLNKLPHDFNHELYKKIYPDLSKFNNNELQNHYLNIGIKEKLIYKLPDDFDPNIYKKIYSDLIHLNDKEIIEHYLFKGIKEGRLYKIPEDFNPQIFKKINKDLNYLSDDQVKEYYLLKGLKEKRIYKLPEDFDSNMYKKIYKDLSHLNDEQLLNHYIDHGINEKRIYKIPNDFNSQMYKTLYNELENLNDQELIDHYLLKGVIENRIYKIPDDFDITVFKKLNPSLSHLNNNQLKKYFLENYKNEGFIYKIPHDFDPQIYKKIYNDISSLSDENSKNHYLIHGFKEKRIYKIPHDFDPLLYKKINKDISNLNDIDAKNHYLFIGLKEGKIYKLPHDFNPTIYKKLYSDLNKLSDNELINHYLYNGFSEKRKYK